MQTIREVVPPLYVDHNKIVELLRQGEILAAVDENVGKLQRY